MTRTTTKAHATVSAPAPVDDVLDADLTPASVRAEQDELRAKLAAVDARRTAEVAIAQRPLLAGIDINAIADGAIPDDLGEQVMDAQDRQAVATAAVEVLNQAHQVLEQRIADASRQRVEERLEHLGEVFERVLDQARPLAAQLSGVIDAGHALHAGLGDAWRRFDKLAALHVRIRQAQIAALVDSGGASPYETRYEVHRYGTVRNAETIRPLSTLAAGGVVAPRERGDLPALDQPFELLTFLCQPKITAWLPSRRELISQQARIEELLATAAAERQRTGEQPTDRASLATSTPLGMGQAYRIGVA